MKCRARYSKNLMWALVALLCLATVGCASLPEQEEKPGDPADLETRVSDFHTYLRWQLYEDAAELTHEAYRHRFDGEFEERGDDFRITELNVRRVEFVEDGFTAHVEVEQEWYQLPSTTVQNKRFMERWVWDDDQWLLRERILRDQFRDQDREFQSAPDEEEDAVEGAEEDVTGESPQSE